MVAVPAPYLEYVRQRLPDTIGVSAQNCHKAAKGAFTGKLLLIFTANTSKSSLNVVKLSSRRLYYYFVNIYRRNKYWYDQGLWRDLGFAWS